MLRVQVVDSHTGGEPTRLVLGGAPDLGKGSMAERLACFRQQHDSFRSAIVNEPRGSDAVVGALLQPPSDPSCQSGVIFFNNVGYLGMCGHGTIGLCATLAQLNRLPLGPVRIDTPVGTVTAHLHSESEVTVRNVVSYRLRKEVAVVVPDVGTLHGDVAWGGNWFFFVKEHLDLDLSMRNLEQLTAVTWRIRQALRANDVTGANGAEIDHIELFAPADHPRAQLKNFVLCPGKSYDRSPCGTGTSAKMACLYADGALTPGQTFAQESICGSLFEGSIEIVNGEVVPSIKGSAFVIAESTLLLHPADPFRWGIPA